MTEEKRPSPPAGTRAAGRRLWHSVLADYDLEEHELALLVEATRTIDLLAELDLVVRKEGAVVESPQGRKANPAAVEARQQRIALARLLAALRLPAGEDGDQAEGRRPQRRVGVRGVHAIRGAS
ncbi:MAG: terminase [Mycobacteriales bacterium]